MIQAFGKISVNMSLKTFKARQQGFFNLVQFKELFSYKKGYRINYLHEYDKNTLLK